MIYVKLILFLVVPIISISQSIDEYLIEYEIPEITYPFYVNSKKVLFLTKKNKNTIAVHSAILEKIEGTWEVSKIKKNHAHRKMNEHPIFNRLPNGTKVINTGYATFPFLCVSFRINEKYEVGDTATFKFKILSSLKHQKFQPKIYFSKHYLVSKRQKVYNFNRWQYAGRTPVASSGSNDLQDVEISFIVTRKLKKLRWLHIVNNNRNEEIGYILPYNLKLEDLSEEDSHELVEIDTNTEINIQPLSIYFNHDSYTLSEDDKQELKKYIDTLQQVKENIKTIVLSGYADRSGNLEYNMRLALRRVESIKKYLIEELKIGESSIRINKIGIANFGSPEKNRVCTIEVLL